MDTRLKEAAETGDINVLYELIQNDSYVLESIDQVPFLDTPLHVAAFAGRVNFVMEMMNLKPSFARKLNQDGFSPMHLALQNNQTQAVLRLLKVDKGLVRVKGREGLTPLHHVVLTGDLDLMIKFLEVCPEAIEDVTVRDETAFHLAVKNDMFVVFEVLMGWLIRSRHEAARRWEKELLSWGDIEANTVLHIAAIKNKPQVVKILLEHLCRDHINAKNLEGLTALDIQSQCPRNEILDMLSKAGGLRGYLLPNNLKFSTNIKSFRSKMSFFQKFATAAGRGRKGIPNEMRGTFLVVTVLIITATYDASLDPPIKRDDNNSGMWIDIVDVASMFWMYNTFTFWGAIGLTAYLLPSRSICFFLLITLSLLGSCYMLLVVASSYSWILGYSASISYEAHSIVNFCLSTLLVVLVSSRIALYAFRRFVPKRKIFCLLQIVSFLSIALILTPAMLFAAVH